MNHLEPNKKQRGQKAPKTNLVPKSALNFAQVINILYLLSITKLFAHRFWW